MARMVSLWQHDCLKYFITGVMYQTVESIKLFYLQ